MYAHNLRPVASVSSAPLPNWNALSSKSDKWHALKKGESAHTDAKGATSTAINTAAQRGTTEIETDQTARSWQKERSALMIEVVHQLKHCSTFRWP